MLYAFHCLTLVTYFLLLHVVNGALAPMLLQRQQQQQQAFASNTTTLYYKAMFQNPLPSAHELTNTQKQQAVKDAFLFAWYGYKNHSWGFDENRPVTSKPVNTRNGWGATIVDSLDTLYIMDLKDEFKQARDFVAAINWGMTTDNVQVFETFIRYVGGLLSAYDLSQDPIFITKAVELVDRLLPAFTESPTGIPYQFVDFKTGKAVKSGYPEGASVLAEIGTVQLELTRLSQLTGNWTYHDVGQRVYQSFRNMKTSYSGLYPHLINPDTGAPVGDYITWGGMSDSFYEYLVKQYVFSRSQDVQMKEMVIQAVQGVKQYLLQSPKDHDELLLLANIQNGVKTPLMDELACFAPSVLLLSARWITELAEIEQDASKLLHGCYNAWASTRTGLAPEVFGWIDKDGNTVGNLTKRQRQLAEKYGVYPMYPSYILRPETLESIFYFYQFTHDRQYQDMSWDIFNSLHTYSRANSGFSGVDDVDSFYPKWDDRQESFFFAETLKYLYLIWDDPSKPRFPFDKWVFNTEAHPLRITTIDPHSLYSSIWNWTKDGFQSVFTLLKNSFLFFI